MIHVWWVRLDVARPAIGSSDLSYGQMRYGFMSSSSGGKLSNDLRSISPRHRPYLVSSNRIDYVA